MTTQIEYLVVGAALVVLLTLLFSAALLDWREERRERKEQSL